MGKRRKKSGAVTHKRCVLSNARPPKGRRWIRVDTMLDTLKEKHGYQAFGLEIFQFLGTLAIRHGSRGSAVTDYAWEWYQERGYSLTEAGIVEHIDGTEFGLWLDDMHYNGWIPVKTVRSPKPITSEQTAEKAIGDRIRAKSAERDNRQTEYAVEYYLMLDAQNIWRRISKGTFPLGESLFKTEMDRLATLRATVVTR